MVVGGGETTTSDIRQLQARGIRLIALAGTGGVVDELVDNGEIIVATLEDSVHLERLLRTALNAGS
jgi:hypothetical protein